MNKRIDHLLIAELDALPYLFQKVGTLAHRFHPACSNIPATVVIRKNQDGEFEVPTNSPAYPATSFRAGLYYTDDREDAFDTARLAWGEHAEKIVCRSGTYNVEEA